MPNPKKYKNKNKLMGECMHQVETVEGKPHEQAVAQCLQMWRDKGKKKCASELIRELSYKLSSLCTE